MNNYMNKIIKKLIHKYLNLKYIKILIYYDNFKKE